MRTERTHDGKPLLAELDKLNHRHPASLKGLHVVITGVVPGMVGDQAERAAERRGAITAKKVTSKTQLLVIGDNAGRAKLDPAARLRTPTITAREFLAYV